jgi:hypothetical protein
LSSQYISPLSASYKESKMTALSTSILSRNASSLHTEGDKALH